MTTGLFTFSCWTTSSGSLTRSPAKAAIEEASDSEQLTFIKNDLASIPQDQLVVLMMHIPLTDTNDRHDLYRIIEQRPFCISVSGHTHHHEHVWITSEDGWEGPEAASPHHQRHRLRKLVERCAG